jgi:CubicO group peptidase (beta-lactamase class C family)
MNSLQRAPARSVTLAALSFCLYAAIVPAEAPAQEAGTTTVAASSQEEAPLRVSEPIASIVQDLESFIPARMEEAGVTGLSVALISDFQVAWTAGIGHKNSFRAETVTPQTVFEVASNSKVVTAYMALRLVEDGTLSLDEPIAGFLSEPWLPASERAEKITLRHLLSHSSGLTDQLLPVNKEVVFEPGSGFLYSGVGAMYVQQAIEQVTGMDLESAARAIVFEPLGMSSSSFVNAPGVLSQMANGHMAYRYPLLSFLIPMIIILIGAILISVVVRRIFAGRWRPTAKMFAVALVVSALLTLLNHVLIVGRALPNIALLNFLVAAGFAVGLAALLIIGHVVIPSIPAVKLGAMRGPAFRGTWTAFSVLAMLMFFWMLTGPVPRQPSPRPSAVGTLRTSAGDLATFLAELARPQYLSEEMAEQLRTPQTSISQNFSWGLGPGIQHGEAGDALWQMGMTFGFKSVMVIYPQHGIGVVVLTNSDRGLPVAYDVAARALGGADYWRYF